MMLSLIKPDKGDIRIFGQSILTERKKILSRIGAIIERPDHYKYLSAYDNLVMFARMSGIKPNREKIMYHLEMVGLGKRSSSKVSTFSMGMKQRLGLAIALIHDPELLILDEPANGLDPQGIAEVRELIVRLSKKEGKSIIISSHLLSEIEQVADSMLIMDKGKKVAEGKVSELLDPAKTAVHVQTTDNTAAYQKLKEGAFGSKCVFEEGMLRFTMDRKDVPELAKAIVETGAGILSINTRHSLEAYFLSLTNAANDVATAQN